MFSNYPTTCTKKKGQRRRPRQRQQPQRYTQHARALTSLIKTKGEKCLTSQKTDDWGFSATPARASTLTRHTHARTKMNKTPQSAIRTKEYSYTGFLRTHILFLQTGGRLEGHARHSDPKLVHHDLHVVGGQGHRSSQTPGATS